jgi:hypothetical protein
MHLRRTLSKRLSKSLGLGIRFSKNMFPQSELFENQESSEGESLESRNESIVTQHYEPLESHESQHQPIISYRPRKVIPRKENTTKDVTSERETTRAKRERVEREYISRSSNETQGSIERRYILRLSNETEGDSEQEVQNLIEREYTSTLSNRTEEESVEAKRERVEREFISRLTNKESEQEVQDLIEREISRWSQDTTTAYDPIPYEERLAYWIDFYSTSTEPLMRCLDTASEQQFIGDLLYESLVSDVKEPIPATYQSSDYRGVMQIREFWTSVRAHLSFEENEGGLEWPSGYPRGGEVECGLENEDALDEYLGLRWGSMFVRRPPSP